MRRRRRSRSAARSRAAAAPAARDGAHCVSAHPLRSLLARSPRAPRDLNDDPLPPPRWWPGSLHSRQSNTTPRFSLWGVLRYPDGAHLASAMGMCPRRGKRRYKPSSAACIVAIAPVPRATSLTTTTTCRCASHCHTVKRQRLTGAPRLPLRRPRMIYGLIHGVS